MDTLPEVKCLEFVRATDNGLSPDVTWFLVHTGVLFFCRGGAGAHNFLFEEVIEKIPTSLVPGKNDHNKSSVVAAGRIKEFKGDDRLHLWGSTFFKIETPQKWQPVLKKILEEQVISQVLATP